MKYNLKRKEIRQSYFPTIGLFIISILGIAGLLMIYISGIFVVKDLNMLYVCIAKNGLSLILGTFFFAVFLYCWILFFLNVVLPPRNEILYLNQINGRCAFFLSKKGKKFDYNIGQKKLEENAYYNVLKTHNYIYKIVEKTNADWEPKEKKSYWLNFYSPMGNFENIFLLPIAYVILLPGLLSFLMSKGYQKIFGVMLSIVPLYIIIYDLIYKIKIKQSDDMAIDQTPFFKSYEIFENSISVIGVSLMVAFLLTIFFKASDNITRLIIMPFVGCGLCSFGIVMSRIFKNYTLEKAFSKGSVLIFFLYWFGFLSFWTIGIAKQEGNYIYALLSLPFWIFGIFAVYHIIKKK